MSSYSLLEPLDNIYIEQYNSHTRKKIAYTSVPRKILQTNIRNSVRLTDY